MSRCLCVVLAGLLSTASASAGVLGDFNLIAFGNVTGRGQVEGRSLVMGSIAGNDQVFGSKNVSASAPVTTTGLRQTDSLVVAGKVTGRFNVDGKNGMRYGGDISSATIQNATYKTSDLDATNSIQSQARAEIAAATRYFDGLTANSKADLSDMNTAKFISTPGVDNVSVFDVDASLFNRNGMMDLINGLNAKLDPTGDLFLFRVSGTDIATGSAFNVFNNEFGKDEFQQRIVWYFPNATKLSLKNGLGGAVIAPLANISYGSRLDGTVVGNNITLNGAIGLPSLILPPLPVVKDALPSGDVPEPATIASIGLIVCGAVVGRYRRRSKFAAVQNK